MADNENKMAVRMGNFLNYLLFDFLNGPKLFKASTFIDVDSTAQLFFSITCLSYFKNFSAPVVVMTGMALLHWMYWFFKNRFFPDKIWDQKISIYSVMIWVLYSTPLWSIPIFLIIGISHPRYPLPEAIWLSLSATIFATGFIIFIAADAHKNLILMERKGLITNGLWGLVRHPNYLGQTLLYLAMLLLNFDPIPILSFLIFFATVIVMIRAKESRLSRYLEWDDYRKKTKIFIPWIY